jgi:hypothetical protein
VIELDDAVYVYGVAPKQGFKTMAARGVDDAEVGTVEHAGLVALTSAIRNTGLAARDVRAHWRVLEQAFEQGAVLPVRFGTVMENEDAVRVRLLGPNVDRLASLLEEMAGLIQLNLKGQYDEDSLLREIVRDTPAVAQLRERVARTGSLPEQMALGQHVEREIAQRRAQDTALVRRTLDPLAVTAREEQVSHPNAFNLAFLVDRDRTDLFSEAVGRVREQLQGRVEIRYVGPVPPFSFADADLTMGSQAWA